jgi:hypothetical protein
MGRSLYEWPGSPMPPETTVYEIGMQKSRGKGVYFTVVA